MHFKKIGLVTLLTAALLGSVVAGCSSNQPMPAQKAGSFVDDSYLTTAVKIGRASCRERVCLYV